jgi:hypothetical protein
MLIALLALLGVDLIKRLDDPTVVRVKAGAATVEVAAESDDTELLLGPYRPSAGWGPTR